MVSVLGESHVVLGIMERGGAEVSGRRLSAAILG